MLPTGCHFGSFIWAQSSQRSFAMTSKTGDSKLRLFFTDQNGCRPYGPMKDSWNGCCAPIGFLCM
eukprot:XP_001707880.1 Hypothetical protein GL50803_111836 [Giardia lamblia ATCC 50803]